MQLDWLADFFAQRRPLVALLVIALTAAAAYGLSQLRFDDVPRSVFRTEDEEYERLEQLFTEFGSDDNDCLLVVDEADLFAPDSIAALRNLVATVGRLESVDSVRSLLDVVVVDADTGPRSLLPPEDAPPEAFVRARQRALAHPMLRGQVLSADGSTALVIVRLAGESLSIEAIDRALEPLRAAIDEAAEGSPLRVRLTGVPPIRSEIYSSVRRETRRNVIMGASLAFLMGYVLFRRLWAVVTVASAPILGAYWTLGSMGLVGEKLNVINSVLPTLVMVIGFTDAVHLLVDVRHSRRRNLSPLDAATAAIRHLGVACALTSLTTCVGFGSLAIAEVDIIRRFGLVCAAGAVLAFVAVITVVPLLASTPLGRGLQTNRHDDPIDRHLWLFEEVVFYVVKHAKLVAIVGVLATIGLCVVAVRLRPDNRLTETIPSSNESYQALLDCDARFGGSLLALVVVDWDESLSLADPRLIEALLHTQEALDREPDTHYPLSVVNLLESLPGRPLPPDAADVANRAAVLAERAPLLALAPADVRQRLIRPRERQALISIHLPDVGTAAYQPTFARVRSAFSEIEQAYPGVTLKLTGSVVVASQNIDRMIVDLTKSLALAAVVIFGAMSIAFRSLRLGLISIVPNLFPLALTAALLVTFGVRLQLASVIVFSICLGIAVDDTIHFINRYLRERGAGHDVREAIRRAFVAVGSALVTTTVVLLTGFGSVLISEIPTSRLFAWMTCAAVLAALVGDLVILPALLVLFEPKQKHGQRVAHPATVSPAADVTAALSEGATGTTSAEPSGANQVGRGPGPMQP